MKLYLVAGEASGDARGTELIRALRERDPSLEFFGAGGREMRALVGDHFADWADEAVVGLWDVLKKYGYFRGQFNRMLAELAIVRPDALVLIDYPGFNLRLAREAHRRFPQIKIIDYISPQVWAWNRGRIPKMARYLDLMLCIFPFEKPLYEQSGLHTVFVGHPILDTLAAKKTDVQREPHLVGLFPGSREKEVRKIFPVMAEAAMRMKQAHPELRFETSAASHQLADRMLATLEQLGQGEDFCAVTVRASHELMQRAVAGMVCSGTATLEAAYFGLPLCVVYKVAWLTWVVGKQLVRVPFLGMPNVLAGREIARELLQGDATPEALATETLRLVTNAEHREALQADLATVIAGLGQSGAAARAADAILEELQSSART
ncbi:MAG: lipid-A-disaccharide synthase [Chthoniobacter sp.]|uniref:lipid-A-disaccharide synthase n=1 Tax=Chthoniobacter sp. TaxID=2510640 RepID=UPI0032AD15D7